MDSPGTVPQPAAPVPGRRSVVPVFILAGVAVGLVIVGVIVWQLLTRPASAEDVARDFVVAAYEGDAAEICDLVSPELLEPAFTRIGVEDCSGLVTAAEEDPTMFPDNGEAHDVEVLEVTEDGDTTVVRVSDPGGTPGVWSEITLARVDGVWRVTTF